MFLLFNGLVFELKGETLNDNFFEMSLEQLGNIQIISAAKKPQKLSLTASSVFVLNQEDIKRSGVTTIPDALRLVPGVQVAKLDSNKWAISIRGFNDIFSNKLLVLMDGRSVYSPFFGGTYWDTVDTIFEDIERIEVIRGPGGTLWGANAVNGVINIITKQAKNSSGLSVSVLAGNEERGQLSIRYGGQLKPGTDYKVYLKGFEKDQAANGVDDWRMGRAGFKIDHSPSQTDKLTLQGDIYAGEEGERAISKIELPPFGTFASKTDVFGGNILFRWQKQLDNNSDFSLQTYYDHTERKHFYVSDMRDTVDFEIQHRFHTLLNQEIIWGLGVRYISDEISAGTIMELFPSKRSDQIYSGFIQDEISIIDEQLILTLGTKLEHNSITGFEYQPNARLLWRPYQKHSLWGAISRAVRLPTRIEQDAILQRGLKTPELSLVFFGNPEMEAEKLLAYELGYRFLDNSFSFDISLFYNQYTHLRTIEKDNIIVGSPNILPLVIDNKLAGESYGAEIAATWQINQVWRLYGGYSFTQMQLHLTKSSTDSTEEVDEGDTPHHQFTVRSLWTISKNWQFDTTLRYVDMVRAAPETSKKAIDSYTTVDVRVAWQLHKAVALSVSGQNLFGKHREFRGSSIDTQATDVEPSVFFQVDLNL